MSPERRSDQSAATLGAVAEVVADGVLAGHAGRRERAARALCALCADTADSVPPLATALAERWRDGVDRRALARALATLAERDRRAVEVALGRTEASGELRRATEAADPWALPRIDRAGEQRAHPSADGGTPAAERPGDGPTGVIQRTAQDGSQPGRISPASRDGDGSEPDAAAIARRKRIERAEESAAFRAISRHSSYRELSVVEPEQACRYAAAVRVRAIRDGREEGLRLRLFSLPGEGKGAVAAAVAERLAGWDRVDDHKGVLSVRDWGADPRPWAATAPVAGTLADRSPPAAERAIAEAVALADAVAACHQRGVVHGGIDPGNVVYPEGALSGRPDPALDNVGLVGAVRAHADPAEALDPRFVAPEWFDPDVGRVDAATDVYGLGATLFRLFTGRAPVRRDAEDVRAAVRDGDRPRPGDVAELPDGVGVVLEKALAPEKLSRSESAGTLRADLRELAVEG
jgi:hypothetical protein